jgi:ATP-dependent Clp protease ATP-binding subunit ClpC
MKDKNFLSWYYAKGIEEYLELEKNFLHFIWRFFAVWEMARTLFYPWKRDIGRRNWRGFQPLKSLALFTDNFISRIIGAVVRFLVIVTGILVIIIFFVLALGILFIWLFPPLILLVLFLKGAIGMVIAFFALVLFVAYLMIAFGIFRYSTRPKYAQMSLDELMKERWFDRVWNRLGKTRQDLGGVSFDSPDAFSNFLSSVNVTAEDFENILAWEVHFENEKENGKRFWIKENLDKLPPIGRHWKYAYTVNLDRYGFDLIRFDPSEYHGKDLIGRRNELELFKLILARADQNNVMLVGDPGAGKFTLIHHLAKSIRLNISEDFLRKKRIIVLDLGRLISDTVSEGSDVEGILRLIFFEAASAGNVILVMPDIENYLGKENNMMHPDISAVMNEYLSLPTFQIIATSTSKEYHRLIEKHESFMKYFEVVEMKEPSEEETLLILLQNFEKYEKQIVIFTLEALRHIISSSGKYRWGIPLPERALDLAEEVLIYWKSAPESNWITRETVDKFLSLKTGSPQGQVQESEKEKLLNLEELLHRRVIGQEEAVRQVSEALRRARSGISNPNKPIGSFLFLGPTGVGKTETAKALAEGYFGNEERMIRLDMSEFQSPLSIDRIVGSTQLNQPGQFASNVKDNPFSLLLLDELEKAYPEILNLFLQILDEGFFTDAFGEKINLRNMIIIATSNAGAPLIKQLVQEGQDHEEIKRQLIDHIVEKNIYRLEFLNRFDGIIFFRPLNTDETKSVVWLMLSKLARRLQKEKNIEITFEEGVVEKIIERGYDPVFGARSLNRFIGDKIENLVARKIISGEAGKDKAILISVADFAI